MLNNYDELKAAIKIIRQKALAIEDTSPSASVDELRDALGLAELAATRVCEEQLYDQAAVRPPLD